MRVLVVDKTDDNMLYETVNSSKDGLEIELVKNMDAAMSRGVSKPFDLVVLSRAEGRHSSIYELIEKMKYSMNAKHSEYIIVEDSPNVATKLRMQLRGRPVYVFNFDQLGELEKLLKEMR